MLCMKQLQVAIQRGAGLNSLSSSALDMYGHCIEIIAFLIRGTNWDIVEEIEGSQCIRR